MLFNYYTVESPRNYSHVIMDQEPVVEYIRIGSNSIARDFSILLQLCWNPRSLYDNYRMNAINLQRLRFNMKKFNCINDNLSHKDNEGFGWNILRFKKSFSWSCWVRSEKGDGPENGRSADSGWRKVNGLPTVSIMFGLLVFIFGPSIIIQDRPFFVGSIINFHLHQKF